MRRYLDVTVGYSTCHADKDKLVDFSIAFVRQQCLHQSSFKQRHRTKACFKALTLVIILNGHALKSDKIRHSMGLGAALVILWHKFQIKTILNCHRNSVHRPLQKLEVLSQIFDQKNQPSADPLLSNGHRQARRQNMETSSTGASLKITPLNYDHPTRALVCYIHTQ